jgi:hypothetical protein
MTLLSLKVLELGVLAFALGDCPTEKIYLVINRDARFQSSARLEFYIVAF